MGLILPQACWSEEMSSSARFPIAKTSAMAVCHRNQVAPCAVAAQAPAAAHACTLAMERVVLPPPPGMTGGVVLCLKSRMHVERGRAELRASVAVCKPSFQCSSNARYLFSASIACQFAWRRKRGAVACGASVRCDVRRKTTVRSRYSSTSRSTCGRTRQLSFRCCRCRQRG